MLFGRFVYTNRGIFDRTHLRFFTRKSLILMLEQTDLLIQKILVTPIPLEVLSPFFMALPGLFIFRILNSLTKMFPTLLGYQFIVQAKYYGKK